METRFLGRTDLQVSELCLAPTSARIEPTVMIRQSQLKTSPTRAQIVDPELSRTS
jgi:hypothetical protein